MWLRFVKFCIRRKFHLLFFFTTQLFQFTFIKLVKIQLEYKSCKRGSFRKCNLRVVSYKFKQVVNVQMKITANQIAYKNDVNLIDGYYNFKFVYVFFIIIENRLTITNTKEMPQCIVKTHTITFGNTFSCITEFSHLFIRDTMPKTKTRSSCHVSLTNNFRKTLSNMW